MTSQERDLFHEALRRLDGSLESAVALIAGVPAERLPGYGGMPGDDRE